MKGGLMTNRIFSKTLTLTGILVSLATSGIASYKVFANHDVGAAEVPLLSEPSPSPAASPVAVLDAAGSSPSPSPSPALFPVASPAPMFNNRDDDLEWESESEINIKTEHDQEIKESH